MIRHPDLTDIASFLRDDFRFAKMGRCHHCSLVRFPKRPFSSFQVPKDWQAAVRLNSNYWIEDLDEALSTKLHALWSELPPGSFVGGPSYGAGPLDDGRFALNTRISIESFRSLIDDGSELILGSHPHPCWLIYKTAPRQEKILLLSGCDPRQMNFFGKLTERNHRHYAELHGYHQRWTILNPDEWGYDYQSLVWAKIKLVADALEEGRWDQVWWVDADAAFINVNKKIDRFLHPSWHGVFTDFVLQERPMLSSGVFGCRKECAPMLKSVWEDGKRGGLCNEESALTDYLSLNPACGESIQAINHPLFNCIYNQQMSFKDPESLFICHLVSRTSQQRRQFFSGLNRSLGI